MHQQQFDPAIEVYKIMAANCQQNPTAVTEIALGVLQYNNFQNEVTARLFSNIINAYQSLCQYNPHLRDSFFPVAAELLLVSAATSNPEFSNRLGYQTWNNLLNAKQDLAGRLAEMSRPPQQQQVAYPGGALPGYGSMQQTAPVDPYASVQGYQPEPQYQPQPVDYGTQTAYDSIQNFSSQESNIDDGLWSTPPEASKVGSATTTTFSDDSLFDDVHDLPSHDLFDADDITDADIDNIPWDGSNEVPEFDNVDEDEGPEETVLFTRAEALSEVTLFESDKLWLADNEFADEAGETLGVVIVGGKVHIPDTVEVDTKRNASTIRLGYLPFICAKADYAKEIKTAHVYIAAKELPMDYEQLSPQPIILQDPRVESVLKTAIPNEPAHRQVTRQVIRANDQSQGYPGLNALASALVARGIKVSDACRTKYGKVGIFLGHQRESIAVRAGESVSDVDFKPLPADATFNDVLMSIDATLRPFILKRLNVLMRELIDIRLGLKGLVDFKDLLVDWEPLIEGISKAGLASLEDLELESRRCIDAVYRGDGYVVEETSEYISSVAKYNENDIASLATQAPEDDIEIYTVMVKRPVAILSTWLTSDEMGLIEDTYLSEASHDAIAKPIMELFDDNPTLLSVDVIDIDGTLTTVYRGVGNARAKVVCN